MQKFEDKFEVEMGKAKKIFAGVDWENPGVYSQWLAQSYYYVSHSTRLLALAASRFELENQSLHNRFLEHLREERGHERLLTNDLKGMGTSIDQFKELPSMAAFYQVQYYWIEHVNPASLFGFIFALEGFAVQVGSYVYERALKAHGPAATNFLKVHVGEDEDHLAKAFSQLNKLSPIQTKALRDNFEVSLGLYFDVLQKINLRKEAISVGSPLPVAS